MNINISINELQIIKNSLFRKILLRGILCTSPFLLFAQNKGVTSKKDSTVVIQKTVESDRNIMLNASDNTKPREVNIGLPGEAGGMTVIENGLPVTFNVWPELPTKAWRRDATLNGFKLNDLSTTAIRYGSLGYTIETTNNLGTDKLHGNVTMSTNHFGLINPSVNVSGSIVKDLLFSAGAYLNYDPGAFKVGFADFYQDQTQLYKFALTKKYRFSGGSGRVSAFYKYANSKGAFVNLAPFYYKKGGKVDEINGLRIGRSSFVENSGKFSYLDPFTKQVVEDDMMDYGRNESHTFDIIGSNRLHSGLTVDYTLRYHTADAGSFTPMVTQGVLKEKALKPGPASWQYLDGTPYTGSHVFPMVNMGYRADIKTYSGIVSVGKKTQKHDFKLSLLNQYFSTTTINPRTISYQSFEDQPRKVIPVYAGQTALLNGIVDKYGNIVSQYNAGLEYDKGHENKLAMTFSDTWSVNRNLTLNYGARLEWKSIRGEYGGREKRVLPLAPTIPPAFQGVLSNGGTVLNPDTYWDIDGDYLNKTINLSAVYNITPKFGVTLEGGYNQIAPQLENYAGATEVNAKQSPITNGGVGVFYNNKYLSLISKATVIRKNSYIARLTENSPTNASDPSETITVDYDIQTMGWTTDVVAKPFKGFDLHLMFTYQTPKYKKFAGEIQFKSSTEAYNFNDKIVSGVSKVLVEIDPSYQFKKYKVWASARYFSKQYVNMSNTVYFAPRWETFIGADYAMNKATKFSLSVTNPLNQRGAKGAIRQINLYTQEQVDQMIENDKPVLVGTYIIPFTVQLSASYRF